MQKYSIKFSLTESKNTSKQSCIKEFHIKPETVKLIEEKVAKSLKDMGTGEKFLNRTAMACALR
jgi:ABC-type oligopeptide transport system ATPase subunit